MNECGQYDSKTGIKCTNPAVYLVSISGPRSPHYKVPPVWSIRVCQDHSAHYRLGNYALDYLEGANRG